MTDGEKTRELLRTLRPSLDEDFLSEGIPFDYDISDLGFRLRGTQYSIYDEAFDAVFYRSKKCGAIIANNTYLSSFAYNLAVVWGTFGHEYGRLATGEETSLARLLRYNLKKFFAEQLLARTDSVFGRGIFLETLFYEEREMRPLFAEAKRDASKAARYEFFRNLMSSILLFHEIGHVVQDSRPDFENLLTEELKTLAGEPFAPSWKGYTEPGQIEFRCDTFAILSAIGTAKNPEIEQDFLLRAIAFTFAVCACMTGLEKSAKATADQYPGADDPDLLDDYRNNLPGASFVIGKDESALTRAHSAAAVCRHIGKRNGDPFAGSEFPFGDDVIDGLANFSLDIINGVDLQIRGLCEMLARALQGNPRGMRYLRLRSKVFLRQEPSARPDRV